MSISVICQSAIVFFFCWVLCHSCILVLSKQESEPDDEAEADVVDRFFSS